MFVVYFWIILNQNNDINYWLLIERILHKINLKHPSSWQLGKYKQNNDDDAS